MDCLTLDEITAYHFGVADADTRARIDEHLVACSACLRTYLRFKHHVDRDAAPSDAPHERPRPHVRGRLRAEVEAAFRPTVAGRARRWLGRPIPLYQGIAAAAVAVAAGVLAPQIAAALRPPPHAVPLERIDTSRPNAESLRFY